MSEALNGEDQVEGHLPKLPVPILRETLETYLDHLMPIVTAEDYNESRQLVETFMQEDDIGPILQNRLHKRSDSTDNWSNEFWMTDMYMKSNLPLPINSNPGMITERQEFRDFDGQIRFTSRLMLSILKEVELHEKKELPTDMYKSHGQSLPLCMEQYYRLFRSYRYPGEESDQLYTFPSYSRHVIVACRNQFFAVDLSYEGLNEEILNEILTSICRQAMKNKSPFPIGAFTSESRRRWGRIRNVLVKDTMNKKSFEKIETSLCIICLDDSLPIMFNQNPRIRKFRDDSNLVVQMIHGGGSKYHGPNRWYDKTVQFIVSRDGVVGLNYEHSAAEGIAVIEVVDRIMNHIKDIREKRVRSPARRKSSCINGYHQLEWSTPSEELEFQIIQTLDSMDKRMQDLEYVVLRFEGFGKDYIRSQKMSPDCFVQLALQLTFYKTHQKLVATYESASIRRFHFGRVDVIRSASKEVLLWVRAMCGPQYYTEFEKKDLFDKAIRRQTEHMIKVISGNGIDNHLLGLQQIAILDDFPVPELFTHKAYQTFQNFRLSTSQVTSTVLPFLGYGPVVPDGYGASYNVQPDFIIFNISAFNDDEETCADFFASSLESSLLQMRELLMRADMDEINGIHLDNM